MNVRLLNEKELVESMIVRLSLEGYSIPRIKEQLDDRGVTIKGKPISLRKISSILKKKKEEWREQMEEDVHLHMARQMQEIQLIKSKLHEREDYKTLVQYLALEQKMLAPKKSSTNIQTQNNLFRIMSCT